MNGVYAVISSLVLVMMPDPSARKLPSHLIGQWRVGTPYNTPRPVGINAEQEKFIRTLHLVYAADHLRVCGKEVPFRSVTAELMSVDDFLQAYGFLPRVIGMKSPVTDLTLNSSDLMNACGQYETPGVHLLLDRSGHVVMEVANDYLRLTKE